MPGATQVVEQRRHHRARLRLPVRLRWLGPLGPRLEFTKTLDASRQGLLLHLAGSCSPGARVWVTFPYDSQATDGTQAEIAARVVRAKETPNGGHLVALEFEEPEAPPVFPPERERRSSQRILLAVPIRVRLANAPWPEETMTLNVSDTGLLFESTRIYSPGEALQVVFPYGRWVSVGEIAAKVVRIEVVPGSTQNRIAVALVPLASLAYQPAPQPE